jgi:hypothetical protein
MIIYQIYKKGLTMKLIMNNEYLYYVDMNEDSIINILDIVQMVNTILN